LPEEEFFMQLLGVGWVEGHMELLMEESEENHTVLEIFILAQPVPWEVTIRPLVIQTTSVEVEVEVERQVTTVPIPVMQDQLE